MKIHGLKIIITQFYFAKIMLKCKSIVHYQFQSTICMLMLDPHKNCIIVYLKNKFF